MGNISLQGLQLRIIRGIISETAQGFIYLQNWALLCGTHKGKIEAEAASFRRGPNGVFKMTEIVQKYAVELLVDGKWVRQTDTYESTWSAGSAAGDIMSTFMGYSISQPVRIVKL